MDMFFNSCKEKDEQNLSFPKHETNVFQNDEEKPHKIIMSQYKRFCINSNLCPGKRHDITFPYKILCGCVILSFLNPGKDILGLWMIVSWRKQITMILPLATYWKMHILACKVLWILRQIEFKQEWISLFIVLWNMCYSTEWF